MANIALENVHNDLVALRHDIVRLEAKIDSKPSLMAMFTGIVASWSFYELRHTHASQLIDAGVDVVTMARRQTRSMPRSRRDPHAPT
jgi:hypothetical protein